MLVDGSLWTWGSASYGQLGLGDTIDRTAPTRVPSLHAVRGVGCGEEHTAAIGAVNDSAAELIWTWGRCEYGRGHACHLTPQLLPSPSGRLPLSIACGFHHSACLLSSGEIICWSAHALGGGQPTLQLVAPPTGFAFTQLACGGSSSAAIARASDRYGDARRDAPRWQHEDGAAPLLASTLSRTPRPPAAPPQSLPPAHRARTTADVGGAVGAGPGDRPDASPRAIHSPR